MRIAMDTFSLTQLAATKTLDLCPVRFPAGAGIVAAYAVADEILFCILVTCVCFENFRKLQSFCNVWVL